MAKTSTTTAATATPAKTRKNTPKVTNVQKRMSKEEQDAWFQKNCAKLPADVQATIRAKLAAPLTIRNAKGSSKVKDWNEFVNKLSITDLMDARVAVNAAYALREPERMAEAEKIRKEMAAQQEKLAKVDPTSASPVQA